MRFPPQVRRAVLAVHLTVSVGWIGAVVAYLVLAYTTAGTHDAQTIRSAWIAMDLIGWWAIVPLAVSSLVTGVALSLGTKWGLLRHYWVVMSFVATILCTAVLIEHMPSVDEMTRSARSSSAEQVFGLPADLIHPSAGLVLLVGVLVLNIYKPKGLTRRGLRLQSTRASEGVAA